MMVDSMAHTEVDAAAARVHLGTVASLGVLAYAIGKFFSGTAADVFGGKTNFCAGMGGAIFFTVLFAAGGSIPFFTIAWMGNRFVQALGWPGAVKLVSRWFSFENHGTVMGIVSLSYLFGDAFARRFLAGLIYAGFRWQGLFLISAAVLGVLLIVCLLRLREFPPEEVVLEENPASLFKREMQPSSVRDLLFPLLRSKAFWIVCFISFGATLVRETFSLWTPTYFIQAGGVSQTDAASQSALFPLVGGFSVLVCGWCSDRLGPRGRTALMAMGFLLGAAAMVLLSQAGHSIMLMTIFVSIVAFCVLGPYSFLAGAISLDFGGRQAAATASGWIDGIGYLGGVLAGDTMARISVDFGWTTAFLVLAGTAVAAGVAALLLLKLPSN
jgi:OPA family glycerol-3-phosphate transporter-like MFS transporter